MKDRRILFVYVFFFTSLPELRAKTAAKNSVRRSTSVGSRHELVVRRHVRHPRHAQSVQESVAVRHSDSENA